MVDAKGKDKRGNGTAGATVTLTMDGSAGDSTDVKVLTDLAITGKPAQFGRGVMQDVSDKLLGQFVACLEQRMGEGDGSDGGRREPAAAGRGGGHGGAGGPPPMPPSRGRRDAAAAAADRPAELRRDAGRHAAAPGAPQVDGARAWLRRRARPRQDRAADPGQDLLEAGRGRARGVGVIIWIVTR